jgi:hypothetical protein
MLGTGENLWLIAAGCIFAIHEVSVYNLQHEKFLERVKQTYFYPGTYGRCDGYRTQASYWVQLH